MSTSASDPNGTASAAGGTAGISANDFLTLLVTEMQNQDPTAATDPNEYINQLVQVNSLEQLISINQTLTGAMGTTASDSSSNGGTTGKTAKADSLPAAPNLPAQGIANPPDRSPIVSGNLAVPAASAAAERVAHALGGATIAAAPALSAR